MRKIIFIFLLAIAGAAALIFWKLSQVEGGLKSAVVQTVAEKVVFKQLGEDVVSKVLGFEKPATYLILFLNNTEIRPGGGFIGAYSVVRMDKGIPQILKVEGTEILDNLSIQDFESVPPEPLQKYLFIKRWNFRDSNWSPDFSVSAAKSLDLFKKERGVAANEITGVIGITPTIIEEILKISGPITVNGEEFNASNFTEKLEYEVEFGFAEDGLHFDDRKKILVDMSHAFMARLRNDAFKHWPKYFDLAHRMLLEKHILAYSIDPELQKVLVAKDWSGEMKMTSGDFLLWVDANMAALKTDKVMDRELVYSFAPTSSGKYIATAKMKYANKGSFTKFTTRYRTYARVYLPEGSQFISVAGSMKADKSSEPGIVDQGVENGKQWFGTFISIEPGKTGELSWQFYLAPQVVESIKNNQYNLLVQKQLGLVSDKLTLDLNFDKNTTVTEPKESLDGEFNNKYFYKTDLTTDREVEIELVR